MAMLNNQMVNPNYEHTYLNLIFIGTPPSTGWWFQAGLAFNPTYF